MFYFIRIAASAAKYVYIIVGDNDVVVEKTPRTFFFAYDTTATQRQ